MSGDLLLGVDGPGPAGFFVTVITAIILAMSLVLALGLFVFHRRWLRRQRTPVAPT